MTLPNLKAFFASIATVEQDIEQNAPQVGRPTLGDEAMTDAERQRKANKRRAADKQKYVAVLDMETDPFDAQLKASVKPFLAVLYSDEFEPVIIWEENFDAFKIAVVAAIERLPDRYTIYAHNGGRFDFMFLVSLLRGDVKFKGRGIMSAKIGEHELRDSFHIIPEKLAAYQKDKFDYRLNAVDKRQNWRKEIIEYCIADCRYTLDIIKAFLGKYGNKLTIGQAAMSELRKHYDVKRINEGFDDYLRKWYFGGRVECLAGRGIFKGNYKLYDVNSEYPFVMATRRHPIGDFHDYKVRAGLPGPDTVFLELTCTNRGALIGRDDNGFTSAEIPHGRFKTTIWEYEVAVKYGLIENVQIHFCLDCANRTSFEKFVQPLYEYRLETKRQLNDMRKAGMQHSAAFVDLKKDDIFYKLILNNSYGKFAMNPKNYTEHFLTDKGARPPEEWFKSINELELEERIGYLAPIFESNSYVIWQKPSPGFRYFNVGTAASITGAARAVLLEAIQNATDPIYCDTDSVICKDLRNVHIDKTALGAWDLEDEFSEVIVNGKKLYAVWFKAPKVLTPDEIESGRDPRYSVKSKGASRITWNEMLAMNKGENVIKTNFAPTLTKFGTQTYLERTIRATAKPRG